MNDTFKYKAFISYSRAADGKLAPEIKAALQKFAKPWYKLRAIQVFCDQTNLTANPNLWGSIERHLNESDYFIYLASPQAAQSKWVKKEIQYFHTKGSAEKIIIVLTDGDLVWNDEISNFEWTATDALPNLKEVCFTQEPTWLDLKWIRKEQLSFRDPRFLDVVANLSAVLRNIDKDILIGKDVEEHKKAKRFRILSISGLIFLAIFLLVAAFIAIKSESKSQQRLVRTFIGNGNAALENKDYMRAFPWYVQAMMNERDGDRNELHKFRIENLYAQIPQLVQIWSTELPVLKTAFLNNEHILIVSGHSEFYLTNEFKCLTTGDCRAEVRVVNIGTGRDVFNPIEVKDGLRTIELSEDKNLLASLSVQNKLRIWNLKDGKLIWEKIVSRPVEKEAFHSEIAFNPQNTKLFFLYPGETRSRMEVYDIRSGNLLASWSEPNFFPRNCHFLSNGDSVIFLDDGLKIWDIKRNKVFGKPIPYLETVVRFKISPDNKHLAISGHQRVERLRDASPTSRVLVAYASLDNIEEPIFEKEFDSYAGKLVFDEQGKILGANSSNTTEAASFDEGTRVWDVKDGEAVTNWITLSQEVNFDFDKEGKKIVLSCADGTTEIWQIGEANYLANSTRLWLMPHGSSDVKSIYSPDGQFILSDDVLVKLWKIPQSSAIRFNIDQQEFANESMDTAQRWFVSYRESMEDTTGEVKILERDNQVGILKHNSEVWHAQLSRDGELVVTATERELHVWDREKEKELVKMNLPPFKAVQTVAFSLDNQKIAVSFTDFSLRVWDATTGLPLCPYMNYPFKLGSSYNLWLWFSKDGKKLYSTDNSSTDNSQSAMIWDVSTGDPLSAPIIFNNSSSDDSIAAKKQVDQKSNDASYISSISLEALKNYSELISNQQMDAGGSFVPIPKEQYVDKWKKWQLALKR